MGGGRGGRGRERRDSQERGLGKGRWEQSWGRWREGSGFFYRAKQVVPVPSSHDGCHGTWPLPCAKGHLSSLPRVCGHILKGARVLSLRQPLKQWLAQRGSKWKQFQLRISQHGMCSRTGRLNECMEHNPEWKRLSLP